jgi:Uma2 family endonuclease
MATPVVRTRRWTRKEYDRLIDLDVFKPGEHLELLDGVLVVGEPQNPLHATTIGLVAEVLRRTFGSGWEVREEKPVALDGNSEPEPDVSVVRGSHRDYVRAHPRRPVLVVEVSDSTLTSDRRKGGLYARGQVRDYWIVNPRARMLEVYRRRRRAPVARFGWEYTEIQILTAEQTVTPLAAPAAVIPVADLLP